MRKGTERWKRHVILLLGVLFGASLAAAATGGESGGATVTHRMTALVFQLAAIIFAARLGNGVARAARMPAVLGEFLAGIVIGPSLLGGVPLLGFARGLFGSTVQEGFPVSPEVYGFATVASILLLFFAGLETNIRMFLRFAWAGSVIGVAGVVFSFVIGLLTGHWVLDAPLTDTRCLFLGVMSTATSVGITTRILSDRRKMDSPEGVTIMAGGAILAKVIGCGIPALFLNFNLRGALCIGLGMVPRCEVVLIITGIGVSNGLLDDAVLGQAAILVFSSMLLAPPLLSRMLKSSKPATRKKVVVEEKETLAYDYPCEALTEMFAHEMVIEFRHQGFFVCMAGFDAVVHHITKDRSMISMFRNPDRIVFKVSKTDVPLVRRVVHKAYSVIHDMIGQLERVEEPDEDAVDA